MSKNINFAKIIEKARLLTGYSQTEFGDIVGVGKTTISNYERGYSRPSWELLGQLSDALDISMIELIAFGESDVNPHEFKLPRNLQMTNDRVIPVLSPKMIEFYRNDVPFGGADNFVSLPESMLSGDGEYICFKATDNSLKDDNISANDYLFVRMANCASDNDIVLAQNSETNDIIVRRFFREGHTVSFMPSRVTAKNSAIKVDERNQEYRIIGIVEKVLADV